MSRKRCLRTSGRPSSVLTKTVLPTIKSRNILSSSLLWKTHVTRRQGNSTANEHSRSVQGRTRYFVRKTEWSTTTNREFASSQPRGVFDSHSSANRRRGASCGPRFERRWPFCPRDRLLKVTDFVRLINSSLGGVGRNDLRILPRTICSNSTINQLAHSIKKITDKAPNPPHEVADSEDRMKRC